MREAAAGGEGRSGAESRAPAGAPTDGTELTLEELGELLERHATWAGEVPPRVADVIGCDTRYRGRVLEVLRLVTADAETMGYLAGGARPEEVLACVSAWVASGLSLEAMREVVAAGAYDPEPFAVLDRAGLLERVLRLPDGSVRRVEGERVGAFLSDQLADASEAEVVARARALLEGDEPGHAPPGG
jgi:hypothetical protein